MVVLKYPSSKHVRTENPDKYKTHKPYKKHLRKEFKYRCVYCNFPDVSKGLQSFGVDHYNPNLKPKKNASIIYEDYNNLFYCCNECNSWKNEFWPTNDDLLNGLYIPNPCNDIMSEHLQYLDEKVKYTSDTGDFTIQLLHLNDPDSIEYKKDLILSAKSIINSIQLLREQRKGLKNRLKQNLSETAKKKIIKEIALINSVIDDSRNYHDRLTLNMN